MSIKPLSAAVLVQIKQVRKERDFTIVPNTIPRNRELDWEHLGMVVDLLHLHPDQRVSLEWLAGRRASGQFKINRITRDLQAFGYLKCSARRDQTGQVTEWLWEVCEWPREDWIKQYAERINKRERKFRNEALGKPECGNHVLASTGKLRKTRTGPTRAKEARTSEELMTKKNTTTPLELPPQLQGSEVVVILRDKIEKHIRQLDAETAQALLDQLGEKWHSIRDPEAWIISMIHAAEAGKFNPTASAKATAVREKKSRDHAEAEKRKTTDAEKAKRMQAAQAILDTMDQTQVLKLAETLNLNDRDVTAWLQSGQPKRSVVAAMLRHALK